MAPKMSTMKKIYKPAAATASILKPTIMKKPAGAGAAEVLSKAALLKLENASDAKITSFLDELSDKEEQRLWKKL